MRILVISNLYPPYYIGGYELGCRDVVECLKARGHKVKVLTSTYGVERPQSNGEVYRWLKADIGGDAQGLMKRMVKLLRKEITNQGAFKRLFTAFKPDVVYVWKLAHTSVSLAFMAQRLGLPVCYFIFDNWLSWWENDSWYSVWNRRPRRVLSRFGKQLFRPVVSALGLLPFSNSIDLSHVQFASQYLKQVALQTGKPVAGAEVIHWGIDVNWYFYKKATYNSKRLLYVGEIVPYKGVHTAIEALRIIVQQHRYKSVKLTIVGGTIVPDYEAHIRRLTSSLGLESHVHFAGFLPRESLSSVYGEHDILVFPSVLDEPFGIVLLEAMASGLAIVGTATGGSAEILQDGVNALVFPKENAEACAAQILRLIEDEQLFERIRYNGQRMVKERFRLEDVIDKIECLLYKAIG